MSRHPFQAQVRETIARKLHQHGIELYDLELKREPNGRILRIFIDTPGGVDTDTCVLATHTIKDYVDNLPDLDYDYLEVSSPGIDRILKLDQDLDRYIGTKVMVKTNQPVESRRKFIGLLTASHPDSITIEEDGQLIVVPKELISIMRLHPDI